MVYSGHRERACWTPGWIGTDRFARAREKTDRRYQSAREVIRATSDLLSRLSTASLDREKPAKRTNRLLYVAAAVFRFSGDHNKPLALLSLIAQALGAREALPQAKSLLAQNKLLAAFLLLGKAAEYLPSDPQLAMTKLTLRLG
jgi:Flp pilus assembly protein TadD